VSPAPQAPRLAGALVNDRTVGRAIRALRHQAGLSQREMGERLGISHAAVSDLERGITRVHLDYADRIAAALGVERSDVLEPERADHERRRAGQDALRQVLRLAHEWYSTLEESERAQWQGVSVTFAADGLAVTVTLLERAGAE
jgi:transcriptional regulator with XRE-family HTH domain